MTQLLKAKGGENHGRQWGVSLTVRKTDRRREGGLGRLSPPPSCGLALILLLQSEPAEIRNQEFSGEEGKPVQAEVARAHVV